MTSRRHQLPVDVSTFVPFSSDQKYPDMLNFPGRGIQPKIVYGQAISALDSHQKSKQIDPQGSHLAYAHKPANNLNGFDLCQKCITSFYCLLLVRKMRQIIANMKLYLSRRGYLFVQRNTAKLIKYLERIAGNTSKEYRFYTTEE